MRRGQNLMFHFLVESGRHQVFEDFVACSESTAGFLKGFLVKLGTLKGRVERTVENELDRTGLRVHDFTVFGEPRIQLLLTKRLSHPN